MHYPLYSSGRYTLRARRQRFALEPSLVAGGIDVTFSGHEHFYQRSRLQNGVLHFISGGAGSLRVGEARPSADVAKSYDRDYHFMLVEVADESSSFRQSTGRARQSTPARYAGRNRRRRRQRLLRARRAVTDFPDSPLEDTHPVCDCVCSRRKERFELVEASPSEEIRQLPIAQLTEKRGQEAAAALRDRHRRERRPA